MIENIRLFNSLQLTTSAASSYEGPTGVQTRVDRITYCNNSAASCWVSAWIVRTGEAADDTTQITDEKAILPGRSWVDINLVGHSLNPGDKLYFQAETATSITAHGSGTQLS